VQFGFITSALSADIISCYRYTQTRHRRPSNELCTLSTAMSLHLIITSLLYRLHARTAGTPPAQRYKELDNEANGSPWAEEFISYRCPWKNTDVGHFPCTRTLPR